MPFKKTEKWSTSRSPFALGEKIEMSGGADRAFRNIRTSAVKIGRKDGKIVYYGCTSSWWGPGLDIRKALGDEPRVSVSPDELALLLKHKPTVLCSLSSEGEFNTLSGIPAQQVLYWVETLQFCADFPSLVPEGFQGWYQ